MKTEIEIPEELHNKFDVAIRGQYANQSEAIRHSMKLLIDRLNRKKYLESHKPQSHRRTL